MLETMKSIQQQHTQEVKILVDKAQEDKAVLVAEQSKQLQMICAMQSDFKTAITAIVDKFGMALTEKDKLLENQNKVSQDRLLQIIESGVKSKNPWG